MTILHVLITAYELVWYASLFYFFGWNATVFVAFATLGSNFLRYKLMNREIEMEQEKRIKSEFRTRE